MRQLVAISSLKKSTLKLFHSTQYSTISLSRPQLVLFFPISLLEVNRTIATLRKAEFYFLGVIVKKLTDNSPLLPHYTETYMRFSHNIMLHNPSFIPLYRGTPDYP